jgi:HEAT repeat protein
MAKGADQQLARLNSLKGDVAELQKGLEAKSNIVVARAAELIAQGKLGQLEKPLVDAFERLLHETDKGCIAKTAIAKALLELESRDEDVLLAGARHVQMEPSFPRAMDVAAELRAACAVALVNMRSRRAMTILVHHLADKEPFVRAAAVRALSAHAGDAAEALIRFKLLVGDDDHAVVADAFPAVIALTRSTDPVEPFLDSADEGLREAAILAIGESRLPRAFQLLRDRWNVEFDPEIRKLLAMSIALTRQPQAVTFLTGLVEQSDSKAAAIAVEALGMYRTDDAVRTKLSQIAQNRGGGVLAAFNKAFGSR